MKKNKKNNSLDCFFYNIYNFLSIIQNSIILYAKKAQPDKTYKLLIH